MELFDSEEKFEKRSSSADKMSAPTETNKQIGADTQANETGTTTISSVAIQSGATKLVLALLQVGLSRFLGHVNIFNSKLTVPYVPEKKGTMFFDILD